MKSRNPCARRSLAAAFLALACGALSDVALAQTKVSIGSGRDPNLAAQIVVAREGFEAGHNTQADEGLEVVLINRV